MDGQSNKIEPDYYMDVTSFFALVLIGCQIMMAVFTCKFAWDICELTYMSAELIWIIVLGVICFIVVCNSSPKKLPSSFFGKFEVMAFVATINFTTMFLSIVQIIILNSSGILSRHMLDLVLHYRHNLDNKKQLMDKIQTVFRCCGVNNVTDWFYTEWRTADNEQPIRRRITRASDGWDSVPFSCCSPDAPPPCRNHALLTFGLDSLNQMPCLAAVTDALTTFHVMIVILALVTAALVNNLAISALLARRNNKAQTSRWDPETEPLVKANGVPSGSGVGNKSHNAPNVNSGIQGNQKGRHSVRPLLPMSPGISTYRLANRQIIAEDLNAIDEITSDDDEFSENPPSSDRNFDTSPNHFTLEGIKSSMSDPMVPSSPYHQNQVQQQTVASMDVLPPQQHVSTIYDRQRRIVGQTALSHRK